jgi:hypothetical protein
MYHARKVKLVCSVLLQNIFLIGYLPIALGYAHDTCIPYMYIMSGFPGNFSFSGNFVNYVFYHVWKFTKYLFHVLSMLETRNEHGNLNVWN